MPAVASYTPIIEGVSHTGSSGDAVSLRRCNSTTKRTAALLIALGLIVSVAVLAAVPHYYGSGRGHMRAPHPQSHAKRRETLSHRIPGQLASEGSAADRDGRTSDRSEPSTIANVETKTTTTTGTTTDPRPLLCASYGCSAGFVPEDACQCNSACPRYNNCCSDFIVTCVANVTRMLALAAAPPPEDPDCRTATFGSSCYKRVRWVMQYGIFEHPEWYRGVNVLSTFEDTQVELAAKNECNCTQPCPPALDPSPDDPIPFVPSPVRALDLPVSYLDQADGDASASGEMVLKPSESAIWALSEPEVDACFDLLLAKNITQPEHRQLNRNWCWVGLKEAGCHWYLNEHITWARRQQVAVAEQVTSSVPFQPLRNAQLCDQQAFGGTRAWTREDWRKSREWFDEAVSTFVLSMPSSSHRRNISSVRLGQLGIRFSFSDGVDMRAEGAFERAQKEGLIPTDFNIARAQREADTLRQNMRTTGGIIGTVGCAAAHFRAQSHGLLEGAPEMTLVFEDDVSPEDDFVPRLWRFVHEELPLDWQAVSLSSRCPFGTCISPHLTRVEPDVNEPAWRCRHGVNYGFQGMLYRSKEVADIQSKLKPVVFDETRPHCLDIDVALASISDVVRFYAVPSSQNPGFLRELHMGSARVDINVEKGGTTTTAVTTTTTTETELATLTTLTTTMPLPITTTVLSTSTFTLTMVAAEAAPAAATTSTSATQVEEEEETSSTTTTAAEPEAEPEAPRASAPEGASKAFCGHNDADVCKRDGRSTGWCNKVEQNCLECGGTWCSGRDTGGGEKLKGARSVARTGEKLKGARSVMIDGDTETATYLDQGHLDLPAARETQSEFAQAVEGELLTGRVFSCRGPDACGKYEPSHGCQCDFSCVNHGNCCADFVDSCLDNPADGTVRIGPDEPAMVAVG